jgi:hypothetical protein
MKTFTINSENEINAFASAAEAKQAATEGTAVFGSEETLIAVADDWPGTRLVEIWNSLPGVTPVRKFTNRRVAVERIWKAIQQLQPVAPTPERSLDQGPKAARQGTKRAAVLALLSQPQGATLDQIRAAVGWQPHSVRGFLSNLNRAGIHIQSIKAEGRDRAYRIASQQEAGSAADRDGDRPGTGEVR